MGAASHRRNEDFVCPIFDIMKDGRPPLWKTAVQINTLAGLLSRGRLHRFRCNPDGPNAMEHLFRQAGSENHMSFIKNIIHVSIKKNKYFVHISFLCLEMAVSYMMYIWDLCGGLNGNYSVITVSQGGGPE